MSDVEFYYEGKQFRQSIPLREMEVDYDKDNNPDKPIPTIHEITIKNNTPNILTNFIIETNLPSSAHSIENIPVSLYPYKSAPIRILIYGRRLFEGRVPEEIKLHTIYKEIIKRT